MGSYGYIMVICGYIMAKKNWIFFFYDFFLLQNGDFFEMWHYSWLLLEHLKKITLHNCIS